MSENEILDNLVNSIKCLGCGGRKRTQQSFCFKCYGSLSPESRRKLYKQIPAYYEGFRTALKELKG